MLGRNLLTPCTTARGPTSNRRTGPKFAKSTLRRILSISRVCFRTIGHKKIHQTETGRRRRDAVPTKKAPLSHDNVPGPRPKRKHRPWGSSTESAAQVWSWKSRARETRAFKGRRTKIHITEKDQPSQMLYLITNKYIIDPTSKWCD